jgi:phospholipid/cholesterol/gamma-HCH transport system substrate-binding protein
VTPVAKGRRKGLSILERNQRVIGTVALVLIVGGTVLALLLQGGAFKQTYRVTAYFADAAGIVEGDNVTVAGLIAGTVKDTRIEEGRVAMELGIEDAVELSADSSAEIVIETLLGRRSVSVADGESAEMLQDGDVIPMDRTTTPIDITELNDISVRLLEESDADAFEAFLRDIAEITEGKSQEVTALIGGLNRVLEAVDSRRVQLSRLIGSLRTLATTFGQRDDRIVSLIDNLDVVLGNLEQRQEQLQTLLESTSTASVETADLVRRNRAVLDSTLTNLHRDLQVMEKHQLDLAAGIAYLENAVQGYQSIGWSSGTPNHWANIFVQSLGPASVGGAFAEGGVMDDAIEEVIDHYFCPGGECPTGAPGAANVSPGGDPGNGSQDAGEGDGSAIDTPVEPPEGAGLPCTIEDVIDSSLAGTEAAGDGGC